MSTRMFTARLPEEDYALLRAVAFARGLSMNAVLLDALRARLEPYRDDANVLAVLVVSRATGRSV